MTYKQEVQSGRGSGAQIQMEGTAWGIRITLPVAPSEDALMDLLLRIPPQAYHLPDDKGIVLDFQSRPCSEGLLVRLLQSVVWDKKIRILAWLSEDAEARRLFRASGLVTTEPSEEASAAPEKDEGKPVVGECSKNKFIYMSMRSGDRVEAEGNVILWGHLNPGAEISAGGSVIVLGKLKGLVHAGKSGGEDAFVMAGSFEAQQVRIGHKLCYADSTTRGWQKAVLIVLENDNPVVRENEFLRGTGEFGS